MDLVLQPEEKSIPMERDPEGYWKLTINENLHGARYRFSVDGNAPLPDPASRSQPEGVHGPSEVLNMNDHHWLDDSWKGLPFSDYIIYELHVGTFTPEGSFEAIIPRLQTLREMGVTAIEIMPIAQFPGGRNWGYDGVFPFAVQSTYGGANGLKKLVDAAHREGIAVILDIVYNHLGPEGNYFSAYAPYFSDRYHTPWGDAINFDWLWSDGVRDFYAANTLYWLEHFHIDALRFDAIHTIFDIGPRHFWTYLHERVLKLEAKTGRVYHLIAESDLNDPRVVEPAANGGYDFDAQWLDDFHHTLYKQLQKHDDKQYMDFNGLHKLARSYTQGFVHTGNEWNDFRKRRFGASSLHIPGERFVVFNNNHDQVGNRADGVRTSSFMNFQRLKLAAAAVFIAPYVPMLFMGDEYAEDRPFHYFVSHSDEALVEAVRQGRLRDFFHLGNSVLSIDAQDEQTFRDSVIDWDARTRAHHGRMLAFHTELMQLRCHHPAFRNFARGGTLAQALNEDVLFVLRKDSMDEQYVFGMINFGENIFGLTAPFASELVMDSTSDKWNDPAEQVNAHPRTLQLQEKFSLQPLSYVLYNCVEKDDIEKHVSEYLEVMKQKSLPE